MVTCKICKQEYKNLFGLSKHVKKVHNISSEDYYLNYLGSKRYCHYCGKETKFKNLVVGYQKYCNLECSNKDPEKRKIVRESRSKWWKESVKTEETKKKIKNAIDDLWKDSGSTYNTKSYRDKLSNSLQNYWETWRENNASKYFKTYGFELVSTYEDAHKKSIFKCLSCNHEFKTSWNSLQSGKNCPNCFCSISKQEKEILDFTSYYFSDKDIFTNVKQIISPYELDIYIPKLHLAIEYNGLWFHSANCTFGKKDRNYHLHKTIECEKKGIRLIHIFEDEWLFKKDIVTSRLLYLFKKNNKHKIYARNCNIQIIETKTKNDFLNKYHLQGEDTSFVKLGAFYNNELVSVMTFSKGNISKGSRTKDGVWELNRFCSDYNYHVIGIASKFLKYFQRNYEWKKIFSYADRRWSDGNLYYKLGFNLDYTTKPNYWYIKNYRRIHRFNLRKKSDEPKNLTEFQLRFQQGFNWIWDCGSYRFSMTNIK